MDETRTTREIMERARQEDIARTPLQRPDYVSGVGCPGCGEVVECVCPDICLRCWRDVDECECDTEKENG